MFLRSQEKKRIPPQPFHGRPNSAPKKIISVPSMHKGDLIGYWWSPATDWKAGNLGKTSVQKLAGAGTAWQTKEWN